MDPRITRHNEFEIQLRRELKADKLVKLLREYKFSVEIATELNDHEWNTVAHIAAVNPPSVTTRALVIEKLRKAEWEEFKARETFVERLRRLERETRRDDEVYND